MKSKAQRQPSPRDTGMPHNHDPATNNGGRNEAYMGNPDPAHNMTEADMEAAIMAEAPPESVDEEPRPRYSGRTPEARAKQLANLRPGHHPRKKQKPGEDALREALNDDGKTAAAPAKKPAAKKPKTPGIRDLLDRKPDESRQGARLSKKGRVQWLERVMGHSDVPMSTQMVAFNLHGRLTGDLSENDAEDKEPPKIDPANLMYQLSCYANQKPERFLRDVGGLPHVLSCLCEVGRLHPQDIARAALGMCDDEGNVTLAKLPLVELDEPLREEHPV